MDHAIIVETRLVSDDSTAKGEDHEPYLANTAIPLLRLFHEAEAVSLNDLGEA